MALLETNDILTKSVNKDPSRWLWGDLCVNDYQNMPWSKTPLKFLFHKSVNKPGNANTPNIANISARKNRDQIVMSSGASAGLKMLIQLAKDPADDVSLISIDTGMNGNIFHRNSFDLNKDHLEGRLRPMKWTDEKLAGTRVKTLTLRPKVKQIPEDLNSEL